MSIRLFFTDTEDSQDSKGMEGRIFFHSTTSNRSRTLRPLFATLHVRWLSRIFNRNACVYQTATRWDYHLIDLPFEWLIGVAIFVCLLDELILDFCYSDLTLETDGFEFASPITLVLQANRLTKCASQLFKCTFTYVVSVSFTRCLSFLCLSLSFQQHLFNSKVQINLKLKEVRYNCIAHRSAHLFMTAMSSHSHIRRKSPKITFLQYSCSVTKFDTVKNYLWREIYEINTFIGSSNDC